MLDEGINQRNTTHSQSTRDTDQTEPIKSQLAFHETMEIHELLNLKTVSMVKSKMLSGLVFDQDLRALLEKNVKQSLNAIDQLEGLYKAGPQLQ